MFTCNIKPIRYTARIILKSINNYIVSFPSSIKGGNFDRQQGGIGKKFRQGAGWEAFRGMVIFPV
jgi:hypothetical protein